MRGDSLFDRSLWPIVLTVAVIAVAFSFARGPLSGSSGTASAAGDPLTLWVAGGETAGETEVLAHQLAACGELGGDATTVGVLSGGSVEAVGEFLSEARGMHRDLLLLTSGLLAEVAYDSRQPESTEAGQLGRSTARLLRHAHPLAVLGDDAVSLAVKPASSARTTDELIELIRSGSRQAPMGIAQEPWLEGALAALAHGTGVRGLMPFTAFHSSREAIASVRANGARAVLAPHSAVAADIRAGRLRELPWPASPADAPKGWIAVLAPSGLGAGALASLRGKANDLCSGRAWRRRLRDDGLSPLHDRASLRSLIGSGLTEADRLQALAAATVRDY